MSLIGNKDRDMKCITSLVLLLIASVSMAQGVPHEFQAGTPARASEVNENFSALVTESNALDARIAALEAASVSDQLFCVVSNQWPVNGSSYPCVQTSDPTAIRSLTFAQVVAEGWIGTASGGGSVSDRIILIFSK